MEKNYKQYLKDITTFVFDVDGVFTDGSVLVTSQGELLRKMSVKDGFALKTAIKKGYNVCIITGGTNEGVKARLKALGVTTFYMGAHNKAEPLDEYLDVYGIAPENVLYMGDDLPDIAPMKMIALPTCPQDAVQEVKSVCKYISHINGGEGCVRDVLEQVLKVRGDWFDDFSEAQA
ncbi:HAD-IIIA family hydrolase [Maribacter sp. ANRC-HE7]|uniref:HAD-IIIA family hydrolase n=1 Tax=Maribacter aquimaris TaxID=2737171 RepID=A0ABR7UXR7_9FLAO|nr:HAD-IIIA family hydrolase [Maribacter aquimaris]MBD0776191.1 HAD-IIIA family hydrolase [Maribacter aquimaris]